MHFLVYYPGKDNYTLYISRIVTHFQNTGELTRRECNAVCEYGVAMLKSYPNIPTTVWRSQ